MLCAVPQFQGIPRPFELEWLQTKCQKTPSAFQLYFWHIEALSDVLRSVGSKRVSNGVLLGLFFLVTPDLPQYQGYS